MRRNLLFILFMLMAGALFAQKEARMLRFPTVYGNQIVFTYAGDLYSVQKKGGLARKLTNDIGYEMFAKFSPDGKQIAFTAQYDGNTEVFVMPAEGGTPKRLTYTATLGRDDVADRMGPNNIVMAWTPDGKYIVYRSRKQTFNSFRGQLFKVSVEGGLSEEIPLNDGGFCSYSPDGKKLAFNYVFREFRTWKYYKGGMADDIRIFDFETKKVERICQNPNQDIFPMWAGDEIFYLSDRDRIMNMFCYNTKTKETSKVTNFDKYDVKFPSIGGNQIAFENGGYVYVFDTKTKKAEKVDIIIADDNITGRTELKNASQNINSADISPDGKRVIFTARGDIFSVPAEKGITYNYSKTSGVHERDVAWSPDGKYIAFISDKSGEFEIYTQKSDGSEPPTQITDNADTYKFSLQWSPDSKKILWNDRKLRLRYVDVATKQVTLVTQTDNPIIRQFTWSPDGQWIAYCPISYGNMSKIYIYNVNTKEINQVTENWFSANSPAFSDDGKYLLYSSARSFDPIYNNIEWNVAYQDMEKIYMVTLQKSTPSPFALENDIFTVQEPKADDSKKKKGKKGKNDEEKPSTPVVKINFDGIFERVIELPIASSNYGNIYCFNDKVYYNYFERSTRKNGMKMFDLKKKEEIDILDNARFGVTANRKKFLISQGGSWAVVDAPQGKLTIKDKMDLSNMKVQVDIKKEWMQIFDESWRQMRDFFYVENMHGLDWDMIKDKYRVLVPFVNHRNDLTYIIGEMIGELSAGHAYVGGGDRPHPEKVKLGLLGAKLSKDASGYYKIDEILSGVSWDKSRRSPLKEVGVDVNKGDFILAVNGTPTNSISNIYELLIDMADKEVELTINSSSSTSGSKKVLVKTIDDESELYYQKWIQSNIEKVDEATKGQVGYIHIRDMGPTGLKDFMSNFYGQLDKKALIIDDRGNGGGNVSPMLIERLRRKVTRSRMSRNSTKPGQVPMQMMLGPKVLLMNQYSASDGDLFPYSFKKHKLGKTIGVRTWGGVVGISGSLPFIDGGTLMRPEHASYSSEKSEWIIEGYGVEPEIEIENDPHKEYTGEDAQLNKAIEVILQELENYQPLPDIPEPPVKNK